MPSYDKTELERLIADYNQQLMFQYADRIPATPSSEPAVTPPSAPEDDADRDTKNENPDYTDSGNLQIRVSTENQAVPIEGAVVIISHTDQQGRFVDRTLLSDQSGLTPIVTLPTKNRLLSLAPGNPDPFASYTVDVTAQGYFPKRFVDLPIYGGVTAIQSVSMIPLPEAGADDTVLTYLEGGPSL